MRALVVDDSRLNLVLVEKYLKAFPEITEIILCNNPEKVKSIIDEKEIDIMLLDVVMPIMSGFDILKILKAHKKYEEIFVIILTSLTDEESFKTGFELGAYDYINKPINITEFTARIKVAIELKTNSNNLKEMIMVTQQQNEELKKINKMLNDTKYHMIQSDKMAAIGQLAAGIAHEINNPMGFVSNNFEILSKYFNRMSDYISFVDETIKIFASQGEPVMDSIIEELRKGHRASKINIINDELPGLIEESQAGIQRVNEIVQSLRVFARSSKDDEKDSYNLLEIINQVIIISRNEIKYTSHVDVAVPEDISIYCNKVQIGQVLINIIVNAAQAIKSQNRAELGHISVSAESDEDNIIIKISDNGPGIPEEIINKIFDPFFTTKDVGQGTGLGLSISYDIIVKKHGGAIEVESKVDVGTVFTLKIPKKITK